MAENEGIFNSPSELVYGEDGIFDGSTNGVLDVGTPTAGTAAAAAESGMEQLPTTVSAQTNGNGATATPVVVPVVTTPAAMVVANGNGNGAAAGINWKHVGLAALLVGGGWYAYKRWIGPRMSEYAG